MSVIIPVRDEAGNLPAVFTRMPVLGDRIELVFVEGHSTDGSAEIIESLVVQYPDLHARCYSQIGNGKGDAVRVGLSRAEGDILMILDADLSVSPEQLSDFYTALTAEGAELANGVRFIYQMEEDAMPAFNRLGNRFFTRWMEWLTGHPFQDVLCGTKALWKKDFEHIKTCQAWSSGPDPFGDFDLLLGAAELGLKIVDIPVQYHTRRYGRSKIHRFGDGWLLFRKLAWVSWRVKLFGGV